VAGIATRASHERDPGLLHARHGLLVHPGRAARVHGIQPDLALALVGVDRDEADDLLSDGGDQRVVVGGGPADAVHRLRLLGIGLGGGECGDRASRPAAAWLGRIAALPEWHAPIAQKENFSFALPFIG
jgi:hypothetical protein